MLCTRIEPCEMIRSRFERESLPSDLTIQPTLLWLLNLLEKAVDFPLRTHPLVLEDGNKLDNVIRYATALREESRKIANGIFLIKGSLGLRGDSINRVN